MKHLLNAARYRAFAIVLVTGVIFALGFSACKNATDVDANRIVNAIATESVATLASTDSENTANNCQVGKSLTHTVVIRNTSATQKVTVKSIALEFGNKGITLGTMPTMPLTLDVSTTASANVNIPVIILPQQSGTFQENIIINGDASKKYAIRYSAQGVSTSDTIGVGSGDLEVVEPNGGNIMLTVTDPAAGKNSTTKRIIIHNRNTQKYMIVSELALDKSQYRSLFQARPTNLVVSKPPFPLMLQPNGYDTFDLVFIAPLNLSSDASYSTDYYFTTRSTDSNIAVQQSASYKLLGQVYITGVNSKVIVEPLDTLVSGRGPGTVSPFKFKVINGTNANVVVESLSLTTGVDLLSYSLSSGGPLPKTIPAGSSITLSYLGAFRIPKDAKELVSIPLTVQITGSSNISAPTKWEFLLEK